MDTLDLSNLSAEEYEKIMTVMKRDQMLRKHEEQRILSMKAEINRLRKKGAIRPGINSSAVCGRCLTELGLIINRGAFCPICRKKVCKNCRFFADQDNPIDGHQWVCIVCSKQIQFKAVSGEWMKELTRSASEKIRSPSASVFATATENLGRSLKYSFRSGFLKQSNNQNNQNEGGLSAHNKLGSNSESQLNSHTLNSLSHHQLNYSEQSVGGGGGGGNGNGNNNNISCSGTIGRVGGVIGLDQASNLGDNNNQQQFSNNYKRFYRSRGQLPPKLPPTVNTVNSGGDTSTRSPPSDGSGSQETSPKPPLSPVIKAYQVAVDLVATDTSRNMLNTSPGERKTVYRKVSNRLLDSSSSEEDEEIDEIDLRPSSQSRASSESTPSPRTPNSCKILSGISANQATAFRFPPLSPVPSRSPLRIDKPLEYIPTDRQSSDEFSTPLSSFRSRSTSSETQDETSATSGGGGSSSGGGGGNASKALTPENGPRNRRISPLRKQRAIAEELQADLPNKLASVCQIVGGDAVGLTGNDYPSGVNSSTQMTGNNESLIRREHSGGDSGIECNYPASRKTATGSSWTSWFKDKSSVATTNSTVPSVGTATVGIVSSVSTSSSSSSVSAPTVGGCKTGTTPSVPGTPLATYSRFNQILANSSPSRTVHSPSSHPPSVSPTERGGQTDDSESEGTVENVTGVVFRKVTIKKRLSRTQSDRGSPSPTPGSPNISGSPRSPLISARSTTASPADHHHPHRRHQQQSPQPRYTQSPCSSPVPPMDPPSSSPLHNVQINRSFNNDDQCRRPSGTMGTYVKSHSAVSETETITESAPSQSTNSHKSHIVNANTNSVSSNNNRSIVVLINQDDNRSVHNNNSVRSSTNGKVNGAKSTSTCSSSSAKIKSNNAYSPKICTINTKQSSCSNINDVMVEVSNGPHRYTKSDRRSSGINGTKCPSYYNIKQHHPVNTDKYFQYRLNTLPSTNPLNSDGYAHLHHHHPSSYHRYHGNSHHHLPHSMNHLHHRLKGLSLDSHAFVRRNIARIGSYGSPAKRRIVKLTKKLRRGLLFIASRLKGRHRKGKSSLSDYESSEYDQVTLERYNGSWLARSVSLPNNSDHNKSLVQMGQDTSWKYGSIDQRLWQLDDDEEEDSVSSDNFQSTNSSLKYRNGHGISEGEYEIGLNDEFDDSGEDNQYKLVFMENLGTIESCSESDYELKHDNNRQSINKQRPRILRVRSHLEIADGTAYIEDSDWEMCSDPGELNVTDETSFESHNRPVTSLFKIYHDCDESFNNYHDTFDTTPNNQICTDQSNKSKTLTLPSCYNEMVNHKRPYSTTLSDPGISLGHDPLLTVIDCPDDSELIGDNNNQTNQSCHYGQRLPLESGSISSSSLPSRSTSPSTPSTLSNHNCPNDQLLNPDSIKGHLSLSNHGRNMLEPSSLLSLSAESTESTTFGDQQQAQQPELVNHIENFTCNKINHQSTTNWNRNRRLGGYKTTNCLSINHTNQDHQVTNWNSGLTLTKRNNNNNSNKEIKGEDEDDHRTQSVSTNQRPGSEAAAAKEQPPSRPPRTHRRRHLMISSSSTAATFCETLDSNITNHSNQSANHLSSSVDLIDFKLHMSSSSSDLHSLIASNQTLLNILIDKHQSLWWDCDTVINTNANSNKINKINNHHQLPNSEIQGNDEEKIIAVHPATICLKYLNNTSAGFSANQCYDDSELQAINFNDGQQMQNLAKLIGCPKNLTNHLNDDNDSDLNSLLNSHNCNTETWPLNLVTGRSNNQQPSPLPPQPPECIINFHPLFEGPSTYPLLYYNAVRKFHQARYFCFQHYTTNELNQVYHANFRNNLIIHLLHQSRYYNEYNQLQHRFHHQIYHLIKFNQLLSHVDHQRKLDRLSLIILPPINLTIISHSGNSIVFYPRELYYSPFAFFRCCNKIKCIQNLDYSSSLYNFDCPDDQVNKVKCCLTFDFIKYNWFNTVWTCFSRIITISETLLTMKGSTFHPSLLLMAEFTLDSDNDSNLTTKTPVNREIYYQDLLLILDSELTTTANMNCHQLSGTETGFLGNLRQTEPTTSPLPHSPSSPPSISLPWLSPPPISPVSRLTPTITSKTSTTAVTSSTLYLDSGPIQSQVKAVEDTYNVAGRGAADAVLKGDYVDDSDDDGDDDEVDVENVGSGGGTGYRNGKKNIRRGSKSNYSLKKAASLDDEFKLTTNINGSSSSRVETAPSRNQSEEESYITRSELENISCKVDQLQSASNTTLTKVSVSPATNTKQSQSKSSSASSSDLTVLSSTISDDDDSCEQITATTSTAATAKLLNNDIDVNKFSLQPYISDSFNGLIQVSSSSPSSDKCLKSSHFSSFSYNNNQERNLLNSGLLVRSSFPSSFSSSSSSVDCDYNDDQGEPINCHSKSSNDDSTTCSYNSTIYNNSQPTSQQLSAVLKSDDQLFLLTCLPIQPTVNNYKQLSLNNLNSNNQNSTNANHNPKVRSPTTTTTTSDFSPDLTLLKVKEVNYDYDYSVDLRLVAASNHQHNNIQKIKPSSADWIKTATRKTSKTSINSTRVDKLSQFSSLLLSSPPTTSVLLSSSPSGLSSTNHQHNHPVILTLCFKHLWNSIVDNLVNQIVPGFLNADNNHNDGDIQTREFLTTCYTKPTTQNYIYLDLPKLPPYLASNQFAIVDDIIKNDYCLTHNQSSSNNNSLDTSNLIKYNTNSENQGYLIKSQYSSSSSLNILSPTIQFPGKPEVIDGNCNIVSLEKSVSSPSSSASFPSSFMKNQQWSITRSTPESQSSSSFTQESSSPSVNIEDNIAGDEVLRLDDQYCNSSNQEHEDEESESMSLYTTNKGHTSDMKSNSSTSSSSSSSSLSSGLLNNLTHHQPQSDDDDDDEEYIVDEDGDGSTSSDESFPPPILPNQSIGGIYSGFGGVGGNSNYGNPLAYSLHTIVEESCEESEPESLLSRISETNGHLNGDDPSGNISTKGGDGRLMMIPHHSSSSSTSVDPDGDLSDPENYTAFQIGRNTLTRQRDSFAESEIGTEYSEYDEEEDDDDMSETSETIADFGDDDEMDPITLASSRLEKYFTSGLLGSGAYDYPDDVEFQDDDPDDLYNQAKRDSIKVEIKLNNNVKSDDTKCDNNVNTNHNNHSPNTNNNNIKNIQFNGIYLIPESNVISSIEPTTTLPITTLSTSSTSTSTSTTISSSSSLSTQSVTITTQPSPSPSPLPPTTVSNTTKLKSKGPAPQPPTPLSTTVNINHVEDDYFSDAVKRKPSNNNDNQSKPDENESTESTTITKSRYNKEINESQISHITVLSNIMEESSQSNVVATSNHIDNDSSTDASKEKETFIKSIIINDTNEIDDDRDDDNHLMKNVSIEVRTLSSPPPPPIVNNLITDNNNTKSVSSIAINNCNNTTKSTRNRMDLNHQSSLSAVTKSNYNESSDIIESVVSKKETTKTTVSTSTPISTTTPSMVTKPSLESTTIRFGPSPQLVRSLLAGNNDSYPLFVNDKHYNNHGDGVGKVGEGDDIEGQLHNLSVFNNGIVVVDNPEMKGSSMININYNHNHNNDGKNEFSQEKSDQDFVNQLMNFVTEHSVSDNNNKFSNYRSNENDNSNDRNNRDNHHHQQQQHDDDNDINNDKSLRNLESRIALLMASKGHQLSHVPTSYPVIDSHSRSNRNADNDTLNQVNVINFSENETNDINDNLTRTTSESGGNYYNSNNSCSSSVDLISVNQVNLNDDDKHRMMMLLKDDDQNHESLFDVNQWSNLKVNCQSSQSSLTNVSEDEMMLICKQMMLSLDTLTASLSNSEPDQRLAQTKRFIQDQLATLMSRFGSRSQHVQQQQTSSSSEPSLKASASFNKQASGSSIELIKPDHCDINLSTDSTSTLKKRVTNDSRSSDLIIMHSSVNNSDNNVISVSDLNCSSANELENEFDFQMTPTLNLIPSKCDLSPCLESCSGSETPSAPAVPIKPNYDGDGLKDATAATAAASECEISHEMEELFAKFVEPLPVTRNDYQMKNTNSNMMMRMIYNQTIEGGEGNKKEEDEQARGDVEEEKCYNANNSKIGCGLKDSAKDVNGSSSSSGLKSLQQLQQQEARNSTQFTDVLILKGAAGLPARESKVDKIVNERQHQLKSLPSSLASSSLLNRSQPFLEVDLKDDDDDDNGVEEDEVKVNVPLNSQCTISPINSLIHDICTSTNMRSNVNQTHESQTNLHNFNHHHHHHQACQFNGELIATNTDEKDVEKFSDDLTLQCLNPGKVKGQINKTEQTISSYDHHKTILKIVDDDDDDGDDRFNVNSSNIKYSPHSWLLTESPLNLVNHSHHQKVLILPTTSTINSSSRPFNGPYCESNQTIKSGDQDDVLPFTSKIMNISLKSSSSSPASPASAQASVSIDKDREMTLDGNPSNCSDGNSNNGGFNNGGNEIKRLKSAWETCSTSLLISKAPLKNATESHELRSESKTEDRRRSHLYPNNNNSNNIISNSYLSSSTSSGSLPMAIINGDDDQSQSIGKDNNTEKIILMDTLVASDGQEGKKRPESTRDTDHHCSFQPSDENFKCSNHQLKTSEDECHHQPATITKVSKPGKGQPESCPVTASKPAKPSITKLIITCDPGPSKGQTNIDQNGVDNNKLNTLIQPTTSTYHLDNSDYITINNNNNNNQSNNDYSSRQLLLTSSSSSSSLLSSSIQLKGQTLSLKKVNSAAAATVETSNMINKTNSLPSKIKNISNHHDYDDVRHHQKQQHQQYQTNHYNVHPHHLSHHHLKRHNIPTFNRLRTSSFFSSSSEKLLKKLAISSRCRDEKSTNRRLVTRKRVMLGGSEPCPSNESTSAVPHISVSDYSESFSHRGSFGSSGEEIFISTEDDIDKAFAFHNRSHQTSLSSFGARSESLSSVYSAAGGGRYGTVAVSGEILFSISYSQSEGSLELYIKECRNLSPVDAKRNRSDPYVKLYLLPDRSKSGKRKTKVKKHTLNPIFDESLKFYLPSNQKEGRTLWISVWHSDIFGRNDFLGEVTLPLTKEILRNSGLRWYPLQERIDLLESTTHNYKGDIFIALKFVPSESSPLKGSNNKNGLQGKLLVLVKEAHNLMPTRSNGTSDPFVKCYLLPDKSKKHKTPVIKKTVNPRWNHTFEFDDVTTNELKDRCLELTVWDYDKLTSNDFLGGVRLSLGQGIYEGKPVDWLDSSEEEMILWKQMLDRTDMWVYGELRLRSSLQSRTQTATVLR